MPTQYVPPFELVRAFFEIRRLDGERYACVPYADFLKLFRSIVSTFVVDQEWYLSEYADVREAFEAGAVLSAAHHFVHTGYFEGRLPAKMQVDENWYLEHYPDVATLIAEGKIPSATDHFIHYGYREGRLPNAEATSLSAARFANLLKVWEEG